MEIKTVIPKPEWIRVKYPGGSTWKGVEDILAKHKLHTVCDEAHCPNKAECWGCGTATFMIMGAVCTRGCRFCAVESRRQGEALREDEGDALLKATRELGLRYVVLTSVDRDDLPDRGAAHFASCITALKTGIASVKVEVLIPDYNEEELKLVIAGNPDVVAHNVETVPSLQNIRDARAGFEKSISTLTYAKSLGAAATKSSILLGLGETEPELFLTMDKLREADVDILVMGQYLQPTPKQIPVQAYIHPEQFEYYAGIARNKGFKEIVSSPFARTSYHALNAWNSMGNA